MYMYRLVGYQSIAKTLIEACEHITYWPTLGGMLSDPTKHYNYYYNTTPGHTDLPN